MFGGTFNPVHNGHILLAREAMAQYPADQFWMMPAKIPPHKEAPELAADCHRLAMCAFAAKEIPGGNVSSFEIERESVSYTIYTLQALTAAYPHARFTFLMGSDMLLSFQRWFQWREILKLADLLAASRRNEDASPLERAAEELRREGGSVTLLPIRPFEISSSEIRRRIRSGEEYACYLPREVVQYIQEQGLYL